MGIGFSGREGPSQAPVLEQIKSDLSTKGEFHQGVSGSEFTEVVTGMVSKFFPDAQISQAQTEIKDNRCRLSSRIDTPIGPIKKLELEFESDATGTLTFKGYKGISLPIKLLMNTALKLQKQPSLDELITQYLSAPNVSIADQLNELWGWQGKEAVEDVAVFIDQGQMSFSIKTGKYRESQGQKLGPVENQKSEPKLESSRKSRVEILAGSVSSKVLTAKMNIGDIPSSQQQPNQDGSYFHYFADNSDLIWAITDSRLADVEDLAMAIAEKEKYENYVRQHLVVQVPSRNEGKVVTTVFFHQEDTDKRSSLTAKYGVTDRWAVEMPSQQAEELKNLILENPDTLEGFYQAVFKGVDYPGKPPPKQPNHPTPKYLLQEKGLIKRLKDYGDRFITSFFRGAQYKEYPSGPYGVKQEKVEKLETPKQADWSESKAVPQEQEAAPSVASLTPGLESASPSTVTVPHDESQANGVESSDPEVVRPEELDQGEKRSDPDWLKAIMASEPGQEPEPARAEVKSEEPKLPQVEAIESVKKFEQSPSELNKWIEEVFGPSSEADASVPLAASVPVSESEPEMPVDKPRRSRRIQGNQPEKPVDKIFKSVEMRLSDTGENRELLSREETQELLETLFNTLPGIEVKILEMNHNADKVDLSMDVDGETIPFELKNLWLYCLKPGSEKGRKLIDIYGHADGLNEMLRKWVNEKLNVDEDQKVGRAFIDFNSDGCEISLETTVYMKQEGINRAIGIERAEEKRRMKEEAQELTPLMDEYFVTPDDERLDDFPVKNKRWSWKRFSAEIWNISMEANLIMTPTAESIGYTTAMSLAEANGIVLILPLLANVIERWSSVKRNKEGEQNKLLSIQGYFDYWSHQPDYPEVIEPAFRQELEKGFIDVDAFFQLSQKNDNKELKKAQRKLAKESWFDESVVSKVLGNNVDTDEWKEFKSNRSDYYLSYWAAAGLGGAMPVMMSEAFSFLVRNVFVNESEFSKKITPYFLWKMIPFLVAKVSLGEWTRWIFERTPFTNEDLNKKIVQLGMKEGFRWATSANIALHLPAATKDVLSQVGVDFDQEVESEPTVKPEEALPVAPESTQTPVVPAETAQVVQPEVSPTVMEVEPTQAVIEPPPTPSVIPTQTAVASPSPEPQPTQFIPTQTVESSTAVPETTPLPIESVTPEATDFFDHIGLGNLSLGPNLDTTQVEKAIFEDIGDTPLKEVLAGYGEVVTTATGWEVGAVDANHDGVVDLVMDSRGLVMERIYGEEVLFASDRYPGRQFTVDDLTRFFGVGRAVLEEKLLLLNPEQP